MRKPYEDYSMQTMKSSLTDVRGPDGDAAIIKVSDIFAFSIIGGWNIIVNTVSCAFISMTIGSHYLV